MLSNNLALSVPDKGYSRNESMFHPKKNTDSMFNAESNICNQDLVFMGTY